MVSVSHLAEHASLHQTGDAVAVATAAAAAFVSQITGAAGRPTDLEPLPEAPLPEARTDSAPLDEHTDAEDTAFTAPLSWDSPEAPRPPKAPDLHRHGRPSLELCEELDGEDASDVACVENEGELLSGLADVDGDIEVGVALVDPTHLGGYTGYLTGIEATISGAQLGDLLASANDQSVFLGHTPLTLAVDEATVAAMLAAAGASMLAASTLQQDPWGRSIGWYEQQQLPSRPQQAETGGGEVAMASGRPEVLPPDDAGEVVLESGHVVADTSMRRSIARESPAAERDVVVVSAAGTSRRTTPLPVAGGDRPDGDGDQGRFGSRRRGSGVLEHEAVHTSSPSYVSGSGQTSDIQVQSVRLLQNLERPRPPGTPCPRPKSQGAAFTWRRTLRRAATPASCARSSKSSPFAAGSVGRGVGVRPASTDKEAEVGPQWDTSFYSYHERRIPRYDALIDDHCPVICSPERLKHLLQTRDLPDHYLHIIRARFEQHQSQQNGKSVPEPETSRTRKGLPIPSSWDQRLLELGGPWLALSGHAMPEVPSLPDWLDSALHRDCLAGWRPAGPAPAPAGQDLWACWQQVRLDIQALWARLQVPATVRRAVCADAMSSVSPESLFQMKQHLEELADYEGATGQLIIAWLAREALMDFIRSAHALGINDTRLSALRDDLAKLNRLSSSLLQQIGAWCGSFGHLLSIPAQRGQSRAAFIWGGEDGVRVIQRDAQALANGRCPAQHTVRSHSILGREAEDLRASTSPESASWCERGAAAPESLAASAPVALTPTSFATSRSSSARRKRGVAPACPLISAAMAAQRSSITEVLHEGLPPLWYRHRIAQAG